MRTRSSRRSMYCRLRPGRGNGMSESSELADKVRAVHRRYPTGVTIVSVADEDGAPGGLAVNAFSSVSLEPPLILVAINATSSTYPKLFGADHIAVNVVAESQEAVVQTFAKSGPDKFANIAWHPGVTGAPLIDGASGYFELAVRYRIPAYTHTIFIGEVIAASFTDEPALIYVDGSFHPGSVILGNAD
ncbi:flavin reductase family protein [Nocardioides sp. AN3]